MSKGEREGFSAKVEIEQEDSNQVIEPETADEHKPFLTRDLKPDLIYPDPIYCTDSLKSLNSMEVAAEAGIKLPIKIPERLKPYIIDSDPRLIEE